MFSKHVKPRSIASQLILLFTLATALLLVCGLGVFYSLTVRHAFAEDNAVLADKISALSADFHESGSNVFAEELNARRPGEHPAYWIRMLDPQGRTFAETPGMDRLLPAQIFPPGQTLALAVRSPKAYRTGAKLFSLITLNEKSGGQAYTLQVAQDRSSDERVERNFDVLFVILLLGSVLSADFSFSVMRENS